jgi:WD40 repeat protein
LWPLPDPVTAIARSSSPNFWAAAVGRPGDHGKVYILGPGPSTNRYGKWTRTPLEHGDVVLDLATGPGGWLASASYDTKIRIGRVSSDKVDLVTTFRDHSDAVYGLSFSPDGKYLASCSADRTVKVWDLAAAKLLYTLGEATDWLYAVAWNPDGKTLAAGGVDKSIRVYRVDASGGKIVHSVFAHEGPVLKLVYSSDGKRLFSLGQDRIVKEWDAATMQERHVFEKLPDDGTALAYDSKTDLLVVGTYEGKLLTFRGGKRVSQAARGGGIVARLDGEESAGKNARPTPVAESPAHGLPIKLPADLTGVIERAGVVRYYRFHLDKGHPNGDKG